MGDVSTGGLGPTARTPQAQGQQSKRESPSKSRRRPTSPSSEKQPEAVPDLDLENPAHEIDQLA